MELRLVDRAEFLHEAVVVLIQRSAASDACCVILGQIGGEHIAQCVAHRDQVLDALHLSRGEAAGLALAAAWHFAAGTVAILHQSAVVAQIERAVLLLAGGEVERGAGLRCGRLGHHVLRQPVHRLTQRRREVHAGLGIHGIAHTGHRLVGHALAAQHLLRVLAEVARHVGLDRVAVLVGERALHRLGPAGIALRRLAGLQPPEEQDVRRNLGAGAFGEGVVGQPHAADELRPLGEILACRRVQLVHGAGGGDERQNTAGPDAIEALGEEIIVQHEAARRILRIGLHHDIRERRIADGEIEVVCRHGGADEVGVAHAGLGIQQLGDGRGELVHLDALVACLGSDVGRHQADEVADAHAGLEHVAVLEAHAAHRVPHGAHDGLGGVVGVLDRADGGAVFVLGQQFLEAGADGLQALAELAVNVERAFETAPADIAGQNGLLGLGGDAILGDQLFGKLDGFEVAARLGYSSSGLGEGARLDDVVLAGDQGIRGRSSGGSAWSGSSGFGKSISVARTCSSASRSSARLWLPYWFFGRCARSCLRSSWASSDFACRWASICPERRSWLNICGACSLIANRYWPLNSILCLQREGLLAPRGCCVFGIPSFSHTP